MSDSLVGSVLVVALMFTAWSGLVTMLNRRPGRALLNCGIALEVLLVAQLVVGVAQLAGTDRDVAGVTFVGYLIGVLLVPPLGLAWARAEPSRWGPGVLVVAGLVVMVLVARLQQIWGASG
ncbi:MAG: hypothetical protein ACRC35_11460 [Angustibacter sp.]